MKKLFSFVAMLLAAAATYGQNALTAASTEIPQSGGDLQLVLTLAEEGVYSSYQWKIETPEGLAYVTDEDDDVECSLGTGHDNSHGATAHWNASTRILGFGVVSTKTALLSGTTVELSIPIAATAAEVGSELQLKFTGVTFIRATGVKDALDDVTITVTIGEPADTRTVLDENATVAPEASNGAVDVRVKRTIKAYEWSTICLPFSMTEAQVKEAFGSDVQIGDFTSYDTTEDDDDNTVGITVKFEAAAAMEANHPYIIKVSEAVSEFTVDGVDIYPEDNPCVEYDNGLTGKKRKVLGTFAGTYVADFDFYNEAENYPLFLSGNKFYYATENTRHMKAFRAYFDFADYLPEAEGSEARIAMTLASATDISETVNSKSSNSKCYDLQGRRMAWRAGTGPAPTALRKGIYVKSGKKVIIK